MLMGPYVRRSKTLLKLTSVLSNYSQNKDMLKKQPDVAIISCSNCMCLLHDTTLIELTKAKSLIGTFDRAKSRNLSHPRLLNLAL